MTGKAQAARQPSIDDLLASIRQAIHERVTPDASARSPVGAIGLVAVGGLNPLASALNARFETERSRMMANYLGDQPQDIWLRQGDESGEGRCGGCPQGSSLFDQERRQEEQPGRLGQPADGPEEHGLEQRPEQPAAEPAKAAPEKVAAAAEPVPTAANRRTSAPWNDRLIAKRWLQSSDAPQSVSSDHRGRPSDTALSEPSRVESKRLKIGPARPRRSMWRPNMFRSM